MKLVTTGLIGAIVAILFSPLLAVAAEPTIRLATIQDQARATRESFLRRDRPETTDPTISSSLNINEEGTARAQSLGERVAELKQTALLLSYSRVISRLENYTAYLDSILNRLQQRLLTLEAENKNVTAAQEQVNLATALVAQASSTIAMASASSSAAFTAPRTNNPLSEIKAMLIEASQLLETARITTSEAITTAKNL